MFCRDVKQSVGLREKKLRVFKTKDLRKYLYRRRTKEELAARAAVRCTQSIVQTLLALQLRNNWEVI
jgi:ATP-dependent Clp protease ATP-binding subunit ClpA